MKARRTFTALISASLLAGVLAQGGAAQAAPGDLDPGFGAGGIVTPLLGGGEAMTVAPNGSIYAATEMYEDPGFVYRITRYTAAGVVDTSFSGDGTIEFSVPNPAGVKVAVDGSNRLVVAVSRLQAAQRYQLRRYTTAGALDSSFAGDGIADMSASSAGHPVVGGIGFQPDGDIIVGVADAIPTGGISQLPQILRVSGAGVLQQTVDVLADYTVSYSGALSLTRVDGSGRVYVLVPDDGKLNLYRYTAALAADTSFSGDGKMAVGRPGGGADNENWGAGLALTPGGGAFVAGVVGDHTGNLPTGPVVNQRGALMAKVNTGGTLDTSFSGDGITLTQFPGAESTSVNEVALDAEGDPVLVGSNSGSTSTNTVVWQFTATGAVDVDFSGDGRADVGEGYVMGAGVNPAGNRLLLLTYENLRSIELAEWVEPPVPEGSVFVPVAPCRVVDTRGGGGILGSGEQRAFQVSGSGAGFAAQGGKANGCGIPVAAAAVEASVSSVAPEGNGFFRAWPSGGAAATATFLNFTKAEGVTNTGAIGLGSGTKDMTTKNFSARSHYVIDIQGYFIVPAAS